jgi:uncharacterized lipoprotein
MKKLLAAALIVCFLSGCSLHKAWKWFEELEWERDDQTIRTIDFLIGPR